MTIKKLDHIAVCVENIQKSIDWYQKNIGIEIKYQDDTWALVSVKGTNIAFVTDDQHPPHIAFSVDNLKDLDDIYKTHRDGSKYVYKTDPDGNTVELIHWDFDP
jgi:catechol 2,3-dioxygenase-like lactoylglutathione lyase family enzyme